MHDIIFTIARSNYFKAYLSTVEEVEARKQKVLILEDLFNKGAESQMRVIDEKLLLIDAQKRLRKFMLILQRRFDYKFYDNDEVFLSDTFKFHSRLHDLHR